MLCKRTLRDVLGFALGLAATSGFIATSRATAAQQGVMAAEPPATTVLFPLEEVRPGLKGVAYTVFEGVRPEAMEVEILGRLKNALGPGQDLILARLHGSKPDYTGVVAGMSGSPVYLDGRLLGALSYRIGQFSKEPIAGITPIAQMLEVSGLGSDKPSTKPSARAEAETLDLRPMEAPLVFNGFGEDAVTRFGGGFRALGLVPVSGLGGMDATRHQPEPLQPGSAVSAVLVQGDLSVTGTCTVSYLVAGQLLACGHPITQSGHIELPMAKAEVLATLASPMNSFKIVNATEVVGAFTEDRSAAISGQVGAHASLIPVTINLRAANGAVAPKTMHLQVANHRELTPQLMMVSVYQSLQQVLSGSSDASYRISGEIRLATQGATSVPLGPVRLEGWQTKGPFSPGAITAALAIGDRFTQLFADAEEQPIMTGVDLHVESSAEQRTATIENARAGPLEVHAGDRMEVEATLQPYQRPAQTVRMSVRLPATLEPGPLRLLVSDGATLDRLLEPASTHPNSLRDTVARLNAVHANDKVYVTVLDHAAQAVLEATSMSNVPLSMANVLEPLRSSQRLRLSGESVTELGAMQATDAISGSQVLTLTVR